MSVALHMPLGDAASLAPFRQTPITITITLFISDTKSLCNIYYSTCILF